MKLKKLPPRINTLSKPLARKVADDFYHTAEWKEARAMSLALHAFACARCGRRHCRLYVDHKVELHDGGPPLDQTNLEPLCGSCHNAKTHRAQRQRAGASLP